MKEPKLFPHCVSVSSEQKLAVSSMLVNMCAYINTNLQNQTTV